MVEAIKRYGDTEEKWVLRITRLIGRIHTRIYKFSGGRIGAKFMKTVPVALLTTRGRKSGKLRTVPLGYIRDGNSVVVVGSKVGCSTHAMWFLNLQADPRCRIQVGSEVDERVARVASEQEVVRLWPSLLQIYPGFDTYKARAGDANRSIPVIFLDPA